MMTLTATARDKAISADAVRAENNIPAVVYGPQVESVDIAVDHNDFIRVWREAGESTIVELAIGSDSHDVLVHEVQFDAVSDEVIHVDFYAIERGKEITVTVPLEFTGEAPGEKKGGVLVKSLHEIEIDAMPRNLPHHIEVSLESLDDLHTKINVSDINFPEGVKPHDADDRVVASITEAKEEVEEETRSIDDIEVEEKGKADDAEGGDSADATE